MICVRCGKKYKKADAKMEFYIYTNGDLDYDSEIDEKLCGDCATDYLESISHTLYYNPETGGYSEEPYLEEEGYDPMDDLYD